MIAMTMPDPMFSSRTHWFGSDKIPILLCSCVFAVVVAVAVAFFSLCICKKVMMLVMRDAAILEFIKCL